MKTIAATEAKNRFGEVLTGAENDSVTIERHGHGVAMVLPFHMARRLILTGYSKGEMPRATAMKLLGFTWYGQLLDALGNEGMDQPIVPIASIHRMSKYIEDEIGLAR